MLWGIYTEEIHKKPISLPYIIYISLLYIFDVMGNIYRRDT